MTNNKIAIVNSSSFGKWFPEHMKRLEKIGSVRYFTVPGDIGGKELAETLRGYNLIIASVTPFFTKEFFDAADELLLISRHGIGYNNVDVKAAAEHGTIVTIVPPLVERDAVAENAVANLMAVMRQTVRAVDAAASNKWTKRAAFMGNNLTGKTVGVIGCGNIGSRVAEILKHGFGTRLLVTDPDISQEWVETHGAEVVSLDTLVQEADVISLNASLNETSYQILGEKQFGQMKKGIYITNTARGALIDEKALVKALELGIVAGFAADVMYEEPSWNNHPYFSYDNVIVTPHISAYTFECLEGMGDKCVTDVEQVAAGQQPESIVS